MGSESAARVGVRGDHAGRSRSWLRIGAVVVVAFVVSVGAALAARPDIGRTLNYWLTSDGIGVPDVTLPLVASSLSDPPSVRIAIVGDVGTGDEIAGRTGAAIERVEADAEYDALLLLGDNVYPKGDPNALPETVFAPFAGVLDGGTQLLAVLGNHDTEDGHGSDQAAAIGMPGPWYATQIGDVLIVALDSNRAEDPDQLEWLESTLAGSDAPWIVAMMHHPAYSGGYHGSTMDVRAAFTPLFEQYGVQLAFAGHDHDYQRSVPIGGTTYVVTGGAATLRSANRASFTEVAWSTYHFVDLSVWPDHVEVRAIDQELQQFDAFTLTNPRQAATDH